MLAFLYSIESATWDLLVVSTLRRVVAAGMHAVVVAAGMENE